MKFLDNVRQIRPGMIICGEHLYYDSERGTREQSGLVLKDIRLGSVIRVADYQVEEGDPDVYCIVSFECKSYDDYPIVDLIGNDGIIYEDYVITQPKVDDWKLLSK